MQTIKALTWDHPRGYNALAAASQSLELSGSGLEITWDKQPLEGFESHPITELCAQYDLVVMDHPHVGEAVRAGCLQSLEEVFGTDYVAQLGRNSIGPSLASYRFSNRHWALPLDAATQVMARRADIVATEPVTWDDVRRLSAKTGKVALSLAGPHAILNFLSVCVSLGEPPALGDPEQLVSVEIGVEAFDLLKELASRSPLSVRAKNPIGILEHMATHEDVVLCPLIYGYVTYAAPTNGKPLAFTDAPRLGIGGRPGSVLGGTGIGITSRCQVSGPLKSHLKWLMSEETQARFIPAHDGQPSSRAAWHDAAVNSRWGNFYAGTFDTLENAYVRPRHNGYIAFQEAATIALRESFENGDAPSKAVAKLQALYSANRVPGEER
ncbi:hypothetical protein A6U87_26095 [Rhizobium sp. AC44/96]|uniref:ABC transporter substrate-binding protein n=1 Tax=Rhizobium sp. AC44/96 TaxID=1841654 RepID=UPI00080FB859|nr:ABC transporter substrate-binding protein [Rhizobium sp. AC44/96]OCJ14429.1 hypothetical protein A6U87_26095 [Rhizobium sp. AC44/96]